MDLSEFIEPDRVVYAARASNKQQLLQDLASRAATLLNLDAQTIFTALQAREELGSTGLGNGFALPHARIEGLDRIRIDDARFVVDVSKTYARLKAKAERRDAARKS